MKIVKRDGRTVEYDSDKIKIAIGKANNEVKEEDKISEREIDKIIRFIESLGKKRMLVEDIQDIIEEKLMENKKWALAKKYIIYRYTRSIIRLSNTTDASILSLLKNNDVTSNNYLVANRQRDVMAGEASKDLAYRLLLPRNVVEADKVQLIKFCNVEYFTEPIIESLRIDLGKILDNGTVINNIKIEAPKGFQSACNVLVEIIAALASAQTGYIYIDFSDLFKYYYLTYDKKYNTYKALLKLDKNEIEAFARTQSFLEVSSGIQTLFYQINTITLANGLVPKVCFLINPKDAKSEIEEQIIHEFIRQKSIGVKDVSDNLVLTKYPMIAFAVSSDSKYDYLTKELMEIDADTLLMSEDRFNKFKLQINRFNQGSIIINLYNIALKVKNDDSLDFIQEVLKYLEYCYEGMLCRNHNLQGIYSDKSPIHWQYGGIAELKSGEKIDSLLKKDSSYMQLIIVGFNEALKMIGLDFKKELKITIEEKVKNWNSNSSFDICITNYYDEKTIINSFNLIDKDINYFDTRDFVLNNYFKGDFIYLVTPEVELSDLENNLIVIKVVSMNKN